MTLPDTIHELRLEFDVSGNADLPSDRLVIHPIVIETGSGAVLVDTGIPGSFDQLDEQFAEIPVDVDDVSTVFLTHHDWDHAGAGTEVVDRTGAVVVAPHGEAPFIDGREHPIKADEGDRYPPVTVDVEVGDDATLNTAAGPVEVVPTPGHTPGHVSLYLPEHRLLLAADALTSVQGLAGPLEPVTIDMQEAAQSVAALAEHDIDHVLCYHGGYVEDGSDRIAEIAAEMTATH